MDLTAHSSGAESPAGRAVSAPQTMASQVMNHVRDAIQGGEMSSGTWYSVYQLSEQLGISRSPVRDGLLRLEEAGLIEFVRNRGFRVVEPQPEDVADIFELRLSIEPPAAARAARDRSEDELAEMKNIAAQMQRAVESGDAATFFAWDQLLHDSILAAGHSRRGRDILATLRTHTRLLSDSTVRRFRSLEQVHSEHLPVIEAIARQDPELARAEMAAHIRATGLLLLRQNVLKRNPGLNERAAGTQADAIWARYTSRP